MKLRLILSALFIAAGVQVASTQGFVSNLDTAQEAHNGGAGRTGSGQVYLYLTGSTLSISNGAYSGLSGTVTAAHIHGPAAPGANASVLYFLSSPAGFIAAGGTSGAITGGNLTLVDGTGGISLANQLSQLTSGQWYINIHTTTFGSGEIRGQITLVPEPTTAAVLLLGAGCAGLMLRRRQQAN